MESLPTETVLRNRFMLPLFQSHSICREAFRHLVATWRPSNGLSAAFPSLSPLLSISLSLIALVEDRTALEALTDLWWPLPASLSLSLSSFSVLPHFPVSLGLVWGPTDSSSVSWHRVQFRNVKPCFA